MDHVLHFTLNGQETTRACDADQRVIDLLREEMGLTGTKEGCGTGECGACTILVDGVPRLACLMLAAQLEGRSVETIESIDQSETGRRIVEAFIEKGAVQCGFCTSGMAMTALAMMRSSSRPLSRELIRSGLSGNLCRCTGYVKIVDAVEQVAQEAKP